MLVGFAVLMVLAAVRMPLTGAFTLAAIVGSLVAGRVATRLPADRLPRWFAYLVLVVAAFVTVQTLVDPAAVTG